MLHAQAWGAMAVAMVRCSRGAVALPAAFLLALAACVGQQTAATENLLAASGFTARPADTPARAALLTSLPPHRLVLRTHNGRNIWFYADPTICGCVYAGDDAAYTAYRRNQFVARLADQRRLAAEDEERASYDQNVLMTDEWMSGFGPWAPYYF